MAQGEFTQRAMRIIRAIPKGRIAAYGQVARLAGSPRAARQVVRVLHSCSEKHALPWHRVVDRNGRISLPPGRGFEEQCALLRAEGVVVDEDGAISLERFQWRPGPDEDFGCGEG